MPNARLGPYELLNEVGKGGMATVYRAYQASVDRYVALKVIHRAIASDETALDRFRREARLVARLEHPHILPVYDFDGTSDPPYIVMRYLDSGTLKDLLTRQRLASSDLTFLLRQIATALDYAHEQGIVHRDIKPTNIMLDRKGNAIVSDFGIARIFSSSASSQGGMVVGTPDYMPPEQVMGLSDIDGRADTYALAVMAFQILTGQMPFTADAPLGVMIHHLQTAPPAPTHFNAALPLAVDAVLTRALAKSPAERYPSVSTFVTALTTALGTEPSPTLAVTIGPALTLAPSAVSPAVSSDTKATPSEQNKVVTVLAANAAEFGDVLAEVKGAATARRAVQALHAEVQKIVLAHAGELITHTERDWLALWGATTAHEDATERAVRAALDMQAAVRTLGAEVFTTEADDPLPLKMGIHTGLVLLTLSPAAAGLSTAGFSATGAALTLAQKLAEQAEGLILISPEVYREVQGIFEVAADAALKVRGRKDPLPTYRVLGVKARALRMRPYAVVGVLTQHVGHRAEFEALQNAYLNAYEENETQVVTVLGEAGLGKSRLADEFGKWRDLRIEAMHFLRGRATPALTAQPYGLWRDVLSFAFEILDDDPLPVVQRKMEAGVAHWLGQAAVETAHLMGFLAGFDFSASPHIHGLLGEAKQLAARARQLTYRFFAQLAQRSPVVVELEDAHHGDDASLDLFSELPNALPDAPLTLVYLARPALLERRPAWGNAQAFHKRLTLTPLDKRESRNLARELLQKIADPPKALRDLLVERAEGNPLFMEELVRLLIEDRIILVAGDHWRVEESRLAHVRVPLSLMGVLQNRLDTLLFAERLALQRAAVFGRVFPDGVLRAIDVADDVHLADLPAALRTLEARGFIQQRETSSFAGSVDYAFAQGMLRDMLYLTLVERQRQCYHAATAAWLGHTERAAEYLSLIAEHYEQAGATTEAAAYWERAGDKVLQVSSFAAAVRDYTRAQTLRGPAAAHTSALALKLAEAHYHLSDFAAARAALDQAQATAMTAADRAAALALLGEMTSEAGDYNPAHTMLVEAVDLARASGDQLTLCRALLALGANHVRLSKLAEAHAALTESLALAQALGDVTRELFALNRLGVVALTQNDQSEAARLWLAVYERAEAVGNRERAMVTLNNLGELAKQRQDYAAARDNYQRALTLAEEFGAQHYVALYLNNLANVDIQLGALAAARAKLQAGLALALRLGIQVRQVQAVRYFGYLAQAEGHTDQALAWLGLARHQTAWSSDSQRELEVALAAWALDPAVVTEGMAQGAALNWDATVQALLQA